VPLFAVHPRAVAFGAALPLLAATSAAAQERDAKQAACYQRTASDPGRWLPTTQPGFVLMNTPAERRVAPTMVPALRRALGLFQALPELAPPVGVDVTPQIEVLGSGSEGGPDAGVLVGRLTLTMGQQLCDELGRPLTRGAAKLHVDRIDASVYSNWIPVTETLGTDAEGKMFRAPEHQADWQGAPRYRGYAVITHRIAPLYLPVTRERWLRHKRVGAAVRE
jgi:hypothetical protein